MDTPHFNSLTRSRGTWLVLLVAGCAWVVMSFWAYRLAVTSSVSDVEQLTIDQQAPQEDTLLKEVEQDAVELVPPATELQSVQDDLLAATQQAAEEAKVAAESRSAEKALKDAEAQAAIQAQIISEQEEAEKQRVAAANKAAEEARLAAENEQAEAARLAAAQKAADVEKERMRLADLAEQQEQQRIEEAARRANAAQEAERVAALTAQRQARIEEQAKAAEAATLNQQAAAAQRAAAQEARRVSAAAIRLANAQRIQNEELAVLAELSTRLQFENGSAVVSQEVQRGLDRIFDPLFLYSEMPVFITVATNEFFGAEDNDQLSLERGRAVVTYLTRRGLDEDRFNIQAESGEGLLFGSHRVKVSVEEPIQ